MLCDVACLTLASIKRPRLNRHPGHLLDHLQYMKGLAKSTIKVSKEAFNQFVLKGTQGTEEDFLCY